MNFEKWLSEKIQSETEALKNYHTKTSAILALQLLKEVKQAFENSQQWQPIKDAPKDENVFIIFESGAVSVGRLSFVEDGINSGYVWHKMRTDDGDLRSCDCYFDDDYHPVGWGGI